MKIALYIEDGLEQIVLTPETETEKGILGKIHDDSRSVELKMGSFYDCKGGWTRHAPSYWTDGAMFPSERRNDESTMIILRQKITGSGQSDTGSGEHIEQLKGGE